MDKIEIPRFLLDYLDNTTIRTPLSTIRGYAGVMLKGMAGPLTDEQRQFLEVIHHTAEQLNNHFSFLIHNQHYITWDHQINMGQFFARDLVDDFKAILLRFPFLSVTTKMPNDLLPVRVDRRHARNAFNCIGEFASHVCDKKKGSEITVQVLQDTGAFTFLIELGKAADLTKKELTYYETFLYIAECVMELHHGKLSIKDDFADKVSISLIFPNKPSLNT
jgi:Osmosensitive K+ channel histidine kinase